MVEPVEDLKSKFDGLLGWVQKKKETSQESGTSWGWVMAAVAAVIVFITLAFAAYAAWSKGREIAKLKHQVDVDAETKKQAEADAQIATELETQHKHQVAAAALESGIKRTNNTIAAIEKERQDINSKIDQITSWSEINKL